MTLKRINNAADVVAVIERFKSRESESNCYLMPDDIERLATLGLLTVHIGQSNAYILENKGNCYRIHYILNDVNEIFDSIADKPLMLEILFRGSDGEPTRAVEYWNRQGFITNLVRLNLTAKYTDLRPISTNTNVVVSLADSPENADFARQLFNSVFDPYSGDYMTEAEARAIVCNGQMLIASINGNAVGALHFYTTGRCSWLGHVAVSPEARGKKAGNMLVEEYIRRNYTDHKSRYALWVQQQNTAATSMYERFGFKYAGKSSLSMIKA